MIRAVLFDLDGTLLPLNFDDFAPRYLDRLKKWYLEVLGVDVMPTMMESLPLVLANDGGRTNAEVFWMAVGSALACDVKVLRESYVDFVDREGPLLAQGISPDPAARSVVEWCRREGKQVVLATNPVFPRVMLDARVRWAGLEPDSFDLVTCSDRMRFCKPRRGYFRQIADELKVEPADCMVVGNDISMDLEPAAQLGMRTCLVKNDYQVRGHSNFSPDHVCVLAALPELLAEA